MNLLITSANIIIVGWLPYIIILLSSLISLVVGATVGIAGGTDTALVDSIYSIDTTASNPFIIVRFYVFFLPLATSALFSNDVTEYPSISLSLSIPSFIFFNIIIGYGVSFYVKTYSILSITYFHCCLPPTRDGSNPIW